MSYSGESLAGLVLPLSSFVLIEWDNYSGFQYSLIVEVLITISYGPLNNKQPHIMYVLYRGMETIHSEIEIRALLVV